MASPETSTLHRNLETLFGGDREDRSSDALLLERFLAGRDENRERAFEAIVNRHGPMVYRVCRQVLGDGHEADDAFQAVFMVLARKASAVRRRESVGSWLHGVALRVAARARGRVRRHRLREQQPCEELDTLAGAGAVERDRWQGDAEVVHQEVARLAERYRMPIVLCYMEGLTHDQAAARLSWPVGTVRSRLARGRDQLRGRLVRRGVKPPAILGPLAGWLAAKVGATAEAGLIAAPILVSVPIHLLASTVRSACQFAEGTSTAVALFSAVSFTLARGALDSMALEKLAWVATALVPAASLVVGTAAVIGQTRSGDAPGKPVATASQDVAKNAYSPEKPAKILAGADPNELELKEAQDGYESVLKRYKEGTARFEDLQISSGQLLRAEENAPGRSPGEVKKRHLSRVQEIENLVMDHLVKAKADPGKRASDEHALESIRTELKAAKKLVKLAREFPQPQVPDLLEAARQRLDAQRAYYEEGRITLDRMVAASQSLMDAERLSAKTDGERMAAMRRHVDRLKEMEARERAELIVGKGTEADVSEVVQSRVAAEVRLNGAEGGQPLTRGEAAALERRLSDVESKLDAVLKQLTEKPR